MQHSDDLYASTSVKSEKKQLNRGRWSKEEDEKLKNLVESVGDASWEDIAGYFSDRNDVQCQQRWEKVVNPELIKGPWTKEVMLRLFGV
jgi:myb proto-oncogene protein